MQYCDLYVISGEITHLTISESEDTLWTALRAAEEYSAVEAPQRILCPERAVGFVPVNPKLCFSGIWPTVGDEIRRLSALHGTDADELIVMLDLLALVSKRTYQLSGGESVRAAVALVAASRPAVWVMDRCFEWLEPAQRDRINDFLAAELRAGKPIIEISSRRTWFLGCHAKGMHSVDTPPRTSIFAGANASMGSGTAEKAILPGMPPVLEFRGVHFAFGESFSLGPIDLAVRRGESIALLGPNGAGKTTLAKMAAGLLDVKGKILIEGVRPKSQREWSRGVVYAFQNPDDQIFRGTVLKEISEAARRGNRLRKDRIDQVCNLLKLSDFLQNDPLTLPLSQRRLVTIAAALVPDIPVVIIDEPTAFLNDEQVQSMVQAVKFATKEGTAVISITHDPQFASLFSGRKIWIDSGRLMESL